MMTGGLLMDGTRNGKAGGASSCSVMLPIPLYAEKPYRNRSSEPSLLIRSWQQ